MGKCNPLVYKHGVECLVFSDLSSDGVEEYCKRETERTGLLHDWHPFAGRARVLMIPQATQELLDRIDALTAGLEAEWIDVRKKMPDKKEPIVYAKPDTRRGRGHWHVGIAYWTVSDKWNPEAESQKAPEGFTYWKPLGPPPTTHRAGAE